MVRVSRMTKTKKQWAVIFFETGNRSFFRLLRIKFTLNDKLILKNWINC